MSAPTRIQARNRALILEAALEEFAAHGFSGTTVERIARAAGLSKPNLLYYFASKEAIHAALIESVLDDWIAPLHAIVPDAEPLPALTGYARAKLEMSRDMPRESRLFAQDILQGAPRTGGRMGGLKALLDEKAAIIAGWQAEGRLATIDPHHLIFSIWALSQHYADFDVQVRALLRPEREADRFEEAAAALDAILRRTLAP